MEIRSYGHIIGLFGLLWLFTTAANAQNTTWNGNVSTDWFTAANWSNGVPGPAGNATIPWLASNKFRPVIGASTSLASITINNNDLTLDIAAGVLVSVANNLSVGTSATMTNLGRLSVGGTLTVNGTFQNGGDSVTVGNLNVGNSRDMKVGSGVLGILNQTSTFGGNLRIETGTVNIFSNFTLAGSGNIHVDAGALNFFGNSTFTGNGSLFSGTGTVLFSENITITGGGDFFGEEGTILMEGATWNTTGGGVFDAGTSTVVFSGDSQILTGKDMTFHNLVIEEGSTVNSTVNVTVLNDMTVDDDSTFDLDDSKNLNVIGEVIGDPQVVSERPYIITLDILNATTIVARFDQALQAAGAQTASNYRILNSAFAVIETPSSPTLGGAGSNEVTLTLGFSIVPGVTYYLQVNQVADLDGNAVNTNHRKRILERVGARLYSRQTGTWNSVNTWSFQSHTGPVASRLPGVAGDSVIVGNGHTVSVTTPVQVASLNVVEVGASGSLVVESGGRLNLAGTVVMGTGVFQLDAGGTLSTAAPSGLAASGAVGSVQTSTRIFSDEAHYVYDGATAQVTGTGLPAAVADLEISNPAGVELTGSVLAIHGTLTLTEGEFVIPTDREVVTSVVTYGSGRFRSERRIDGPRGWRNLSSPVRTTYGGFYQNLITQGYPGSTFPDRQPTVMWYDETYPGTDLQRWRVASAATDSLVAGRGLYTYVFGTVPDEPDYQEVLPKDLVAVGREIAPGADAFTWPVTYTPAADSGWNLIGNPYLATLDWDAPGWVKEGIDQVLYVWDPAANSGHGAYLEWNGVEGTLTDGRIKPYQAFWVKANAAAPVLQAPASARTSGGTFRRHRPDHPGIEIVVWSDGLESTHILHFSEDGSRFMDPWDAYKLQSMSTTSMDVYSINDAGDRLAINHLPLRFSGTLRIPIGVDLVRSDRTSPDLVTMEARLQGDAAHRFDVRITDTRSGRILELGNTYGGFDFESEVRQMKAGPGMRPVLAKAEPGRARFLVEITPLHADPDIPTQVGLGYNYPNPFNPETVIPVDLPMEDRIRLAVFDVLGRQVALLADGVRSAGRQEFRFDGRGLASGVYIVRLETGDGHTSVRRMTLLK